MPKKKKKKGEPAISPPSATGGAGPWFEGKVGAFYLLSLLSSSEPRGLPGATATSVQFQQAPAGRPLDDFTIEAVNADGSRAHLEIQAKRSLDFTKSDAEFEDVVRRMWRAAQRPEFATDRYELAVAISRTTTRIERSCQEVLHWARELPGGELLQRLEPPLLQNKGQRLRELIKLMLAVESQPLSKVVAQVSPNLPIPAGVEGMVIPKGESWGWLAVWVLGRADALPDALIPDLAKLFQAWLIATQAYGGELNALVVGLLFKWLRRLDDTVG